MPSCKKRVYRTMCEQADGTRSGRYKKNRYNSVPIDAKKSASGTKKAAKPTKNTKSKAKPVKMPVIDYEDDYDRHLDDLEMDRDLEKDYELWRQKEYLRDQFAKRQASKRKKYTNTKKNHDDEAYAIISKSIERAGKTDFNKVLDEADRRVQAEHPKDAYSRMRKAKRKKYTTNQVDMKRYIVSKSELNVYSPYFRDQKITYAKDIDHLRAALCKDTQKFHYVYTPEGQYLGTFMKIDMRSPNNPNGKVEYWWQAPIRKGSPVEDTYTINPRDGSIRRK